MLIFGVIILYKCDISKSKTIRSINTVFKKNPDFYSKFEFIVYDNSVSYNSIRKINENFSFKYSYINNNRNDGLAIAYNYALNFCNNRSAKWLVLLDQDSTLTFSFFHNLLQDISEIKNENIYAIAPNMFYNNKKFSPSKIIPGGIHRPLKLHGKSIFNKPIFAIGSCTTINTNFFKSIGGFNEIFWLDCLDRWIYFMIFKNRGSVLISETNILHDLSILDYDKFLNENRYKNILFYETLFIRLYKSKLDNFIYFFRLLFRTIIFLSKKNKYKYFKINIFHITNQFFIIQHL